MGDNPQGYIGSVEKYRDCITLLQINKIKARVYAVVFDIKKFYPVIKEPCPKKALDISEAYIVASTDNKSINYQLRVFAATKKVYRVITQLGSMTKQGCVNYLVIFCLMNYKNKYEKNEIGLQKEDGSVVFKNKSGPKSEKSKKNIQVIFCKCKLKTKAKFNLKVVD